MKVDYLFEEMKGMEVQEAINYLHSLYAEDEYYNVSNICFPSEEEKVFRLLLANSWYLNNVKRQEMVYDFLCLEGKNPEAVWYDDEEYYNDCYDIDYQGDYDKALQEVKEQEDKAINDALEIMMAEAQDRNAAESFVKYHDLLPVHNWSTYTRYISVFWGVYKNEFFNEWSFRYDMNHSEEYYQDDWQELEKYPEEGSVDELNKDLDSLIDENDLPF